MESTETQKKKRPKRKRLNRKRRKRLKKEREARGEKTPPPKFKRYLRKMRKNFKDLDVNVKFYKFQPLTLKDMSIFVFEIVKRLEELTVRDDNYAKLFHLIKVTYLSDILPSNLKEYFGHQIQFRMMKKLRTCATNIVLYFLQATTNRRKVTNDCLNLKFKSLLETYFQICFNDELNFFIPSMWENVLNVIHGLRYIDDSVSDLYLFYIKQCFDEQSFKCRIIDARRLIRMQYEYYDRQDIFQKITDLLNIIYPLRDAFVDIAETVTSQALTSTRCSLCQDSEDFKDEADKINHFHSASHSEQLNAVIYNKFNSELAMNSDDFSYCLLCQEIKLKGHNHEDDVKYLEFKECFCYICGISLQKTNSRDHFYIDSIHCNIFAALSGNTAEYLQLHGGDTLLSMSLTADEINNHVQVYFFEMAANRHQNDRNIYLQKLERKLRKKTCEFVKIFLKFYDPNNPRYPLILREILWDQDILEDIFHSLLIIRPTKKIYSKEYRLYADYLPEMELYKIPMSSVEFNKLLTNKRKECYDKAIKSIEGIYEQQMTEEQTGTETELNEMKIVMLNMFGSNFIPFTLLPTCLKNLEKIVDSKYSL